jgi:glycolate oxidase FAD binding subunit
MTSTSTTLEGNFRSILGEDQFRVSSHADGIYGVQPQFILEPTTEQQLASALRLANESKLTVIPRGGGTKLEWGNPPSRADLILSTARLSETLEHAWADLTVTVEAGCTFQTLQRALAQHGQRLAVDPLWPERATIGGILSTNDSGALRLRFGALRDLVIGVTIALPDGTLASSGGKVVKNVAGYDLPKLVTGALGTLGVITRAVFRLHPIPHNTRSFSISTANAEDTQRLVLAIQDSQLAHVALQSHFRAEATPSIDIRFEGTEAGLDAQAAHLQTLCYTAQISETSLKVWDAHEDLWSFSNPGETTITKISALPADLAHTFELIRGAADSTHLRWKSLMYATGLGWLRLEGPSDKLHGALTNVRANLEKMGGSLVLLHRPAALPSFDAWGTPGDSLPLMRSIKRQLDPANTLNPCRFVGGI